MRNYEWIDQYLDILAQDVYNQPSDKGHDALLSDAMKDWEHYFDEIENVLDIGCGPECIAKPYFDKHSVVYYGLDADPSIHSIFVMQGDMSFTNAVDNQYDAIFARHVLEHSPMVLLTLLEWHRISNHYLFLILPNPAHFGYIGRNHYAVMPKTQIRWLLRRAGWKIIEKETTEEEYRFVCEKKPLISYEGFAAVPLPNYVYEADRDDKLEKDILGV